MAIRIPQLEGTLKYHVFIAHAEPDRSVSLELMEDLESRGLSCLLGDRDFTPGRYIVDNIVHAINKSRRVLLVLSRSFLASAWCTFEVIVAMEKMNNDNHVTIVPLLVDVGNDDVPQMIKHITYISMKETGFRTKLAKALAAPDVPISDLLPAGNVAHGLAWSYYYGYLAIVLPDLKEYIENTDLWKKLNSKGKKVIARKLYIIVPKSCFCPKSLTDVDWRIRHDQNIIAATRDTSGTVNRKYTTSIWRLQGNEGQELYFAGEFPTVLNTMYQMEKGQVAGLSSENMLFQIQRFDKTLTRILHHQHSKECHGRYSIIYYDDKDETRRNKLYEILEARISRDIEIEAEEEKVEVAFAEVPEEFVML